MKNFVNGKIGEVKAIIRRYIIINTTVSIVSIGITLLLMKPVIEYLVPKHIVGIQFVWWIIPGLTIYIVLQPIRLVFNGSLNLAPFVWASCISLLFQQFLLSLGLLNQLNLIYVAIIKSVTYIILDLYFWHFILAAGSQSIKLTIKTSFKRRDKII